MVGAELLEGLFKRFHLNSIIAYATAGVILGPVTGVHRLHLQPRNS